MSEPGSSGEMSLTDTRPLSAQSSNAFPVKTTYNGPLPVSDIIGWDVRNWSQCLPFWKPWLKTNENGPLKILAIGERNGGLSLWFAFMGYDVICSDYRGPGEQAKRVHTKYQVGHKITYADVDIFHLPYPDNYFDVIACKSVIGGVSLDYKDRSTRTLDNQKIAANEIRRALKPGGVFFGAENLTGTGAHLALRNLRRKGNLGWRYLKISEIQWMFDDYSQIEQKPYGFVGAQWTNLCGINALCGFIDAGFSRILPANWQYISFIRARK